MEGKNKINGGGRKIMSETMRCFLAFDIENNEVLRKLVNLQQQMVKTGATLKIVPPKNIHITMRFLGNVTYDLIKKISNKIQEIEFDSFHAEIKGIGVFPNITRPRVVWVGINKGSEKLIKIFNQIGPHLKKLGFHPDFKNFSPHLTIARVKSPKNKDRLIDFVKKNSSCNLGDIKITSLKLKKSDLSRNGPIYTTIKQFHPKVEV
jgi:2'-5' RNA ligase